LEKQLRLDVAQLTDVGRKREHNEDNMAFVIPKDVTVMAGKGALFIVADGMGGHAAGEVASEIAVDTVSNMYYQEDSDDVAVSLLRAIKRANTSIHQRAAENLLRTGMGTTCVAAVLRGNMAYIANVGDSRAYLVRGNHAKQISRDHSWVAEQVRAGLLTEEQARTHAQRNVITRCLGTQPEVDIDVFHEELLEGDFLVLCTDGLSGLVSDEDLEHIVDQFVPQESVYHLIERANENGGPDNITAIVIGVQEVGEEPPNMRYLVGVGGREVGEDTLTLGMFSDATYAGLSNGEIGISSGPLRLSSGPLLSSPDSITAPQPAMGKRKSGRGRLFYPTIAIVALVLITLVGGGLFYFLRSESQAANQALDVAQQKITSVTAQSQSPTSALTTLASAQTALVSVQKNYQLDDVQLQRVAMLQKELANNVQSAIMTYNQQAKIFLLPCNSTNDPIDNTSSHATPASIAFVEGLKNTPLRYTLAHNTQSQHVELYQITNPVHNQYGMVSPLPAGKPAPVFITMASNGSLLFLMQKQVKGSSPPTFTLSSYQPGQQGTLGTPLSTTQVDAKFVPNGYIPVFMAAWGNTVYVMLSSQSDSGNARIISYVLDAKKHLSAPKETKISISAPIVSIAAFPHQLFLLLVSGGIQSVSFRSGNPPQPVLVQSQIAPPLSISPTDYNAKAPVPTVTTGGLDGSAGAVSIPSTLPNTPAMLTAGQINGVPHLYVGDPANSRILNLESSQGGSTTANSQGTPVVASSVKLQLDQQFVSLADFKQVKSLATDRQGNLLALLAAPSQNASIANLVSIDTHTVPDTCPTSSS
jgi:serine/threonine protein phosphatase PrpC